MKELVGLFMLLYSLGQVVLDRERPEQFLYKLDRYSRGKCVTAGQYIPAEKGRAVRSSRLDYRTPQVPCAFGSASIGPLGPPSRTLALHSPI